MASSAETDAFRHYYLRAIGVSTPFQAAACAPSSVVEVVAAPSPPAMDAASHEPPAEYSPSSGAAGDLDSLRARVQACTACALSATRLQAVFGVGNPHPDVLFIGEAPGEQEDIQGEPFVGKAGKFLDRMLAALGWSRQNVYIMNVVKCRPPNNRNPQSEEVEACSRWFDAQLAALQPKIICLLGRVAAQRVLGSDASLSALRGRWHEYRGMPVWVSYHPAYLLRSPAQKALAWKDFRMLARRAAALKAADPA